jgi:hypothetical protein
MIIRNYSLHTRTAVVEKTTQVLVDSKEQGQQPHTVATGQSHNLADTLPGIASQWGIPCIAFVVPGPWRSVRTQRVAQPQPQQLALLLLVRLDVVGLRHVLQGAGRFVRAWPENTNFRSKYRYQRLGIQWFLRGDSGYWWRRSVIVERD